MENPSFHFTGQMADSEYGIEWVSGLLMSMLWIEWPMVAVRLWSGQAYVMDIKHRCILLIFISIQQICSAIEEEWTNIPQSTKIY